MRFRFKITLHIDDIETLNIIRSTLGIGIVKEENKQYCTKLAPYFITGFSDAESSFSASIVKKSDRKLSHLVQLYYIINLHKKDLALLYRIQSFFGVGDVSQRGEIVTYRVTKIKDLTNVIIPHFIKYPLITQKQADFLLFKMIIKLMNQKEHLSIEGLHKIVSIRTSMNKGLSEELVTSFPSITPVERPVVDRTENLDPN